MNQYKTCKRCNTNKLHSEFHKNPQNKTTGLHSICKVCRMNQYKQYAEDNHDFVIQSKANYRANNKELISFKKRKNYALHKDKIKLQNRESSKRHLNAMAERTRLRRFRLKNVPTYFISRRELKKYYSQPCFYCGSNQQITIDHVIPISRGGSHSVGNLVSCCRSCNSSKLNKTIMEWKMKRIRHEKISRSLS